MLFEQFGCSTGVVGELQLVFANSDGVGVAIYHFWKTYIHKIRYMGKFDCQIASELMVYKRRESGLEQIGQLGGV